MLNYVMTMLTDFDLELIILFRVQTKCHNGGESILTYNEIRLHTTLYQYVSPDLIEAPKSNLYTCYSMV